MTTYKFGDIVLVGFPHTDLQGVSKRPAIVLHDSGDQDIFCEAFRVIFHVKSYLYCPSFPHLSSL